jgi:hypothetical protein
MSLSTYELVEIIHNVGNQFRDEMTEAQRTKQPPSVVLALAVTSRALNRVVELAAVHAKEG